MEKRKCYIIMRGQYNDGHWFEEPVSVFLSKVDAIGEKNRMNNSRDKGNLKHWRNGEWEFEYVLRISKFYE